MKLNEEEKKAINYLENEYKKLEEEGNILFPLYKQQAKTVLNLIEKLQKENEDLKKYDYRNIKLDDKDKLKSPYISKEILDYIKVLMFFNDEEE